MKPKKLRTQRLNLDFQTPLNPLPHEQSKTQFQKMKDDLNRRFSTPEK